MKTFFITLLWVYSQAALAQPPNNAVFNGGTSDGWTVAGSLQSAGNIFAGGNGQGWHTQAFQQPTVAIFSGGNGDGWSFNAFQQLGNAIFSGGIDDGWNYHLFAQAANEIFSGGQGDGWASTYRPLGILPVTFVDFTAQKQSATSLLKWQTSSETNTATFEVERSSDAIFFKKIGVVTAAGTSNSLRKYEFVDQQTVSGANYYRLKQLDRNGAFVYTPTRMLLFDAASLLSLKIYPVPASTIVTIELPQQLQNEHLALNISNAGGVMVQQIKVYRNTSNRQVLDITAFPPGVYTLQLSSATFNATQTIIKL